MTFQIVVNLIISFMWMFLSESYTFITFIFGYILGALLLLLLNRFFPSRYYLAPIYRFFVLFLIFVRELILSNIDIVKLVYKRKPDFEPGIFALPVEVKKNWEITLLANLITLTPGTLSVAISDDQSQIFIHAMDIDDIEESIDDIKNTFEKAIMEVTK
ncbi:Na+/H+ antiporter subunit E [Pseudogracilibacillus auburnensis]|uniref:Multisubunit sodium/proton antiporter MrpE subunit n=1 Tax=Pseudogracilibacillus auburnensis TaxID=1494959 RepID=A0A2V3VX51_9BACI|nr:Na+/H+ antiporter subunit E [Pseudogracilibacillus auburnensis]MBO1003445.1 Na+/H+ antiporter subunit E [Pseudogracilibacillus auburnensis]PXW86567.1 multisubunit sodium/proton antiporter MrpE subunit [Pseudogracilibacillus auburnensis]